MIFTIEVIALVVVTIVTIVPMVVGNKQNNWQHQRPDSLVMWIIDGAIQRLNRGNHHPTVSKPELCLWNPVLKELPVCSVCVAGVAGQQQSAP